MKKIFILLLIANLSQAQLPMVMNRMPVYQKLTNGAFELRTWLDAGIKISYSGSGSLWNDLTGFNCHASLLNGVTYNSSNGGNLVFDGVNDYATIAVSSDTNLDTSSISATVVLKFTGTGVYTPAGRAGISGDINTGWYFYTLSGKIASRFAYNSANYDVQSPLTYNDGNWHIVTAVYQRSGNMTLYIDNVNVGSTSISAANGVSINLINALELGRRSSFGDLYFPGSIANFQLHFKALDVNEVGMVYNLLKNRYQ